MANVNENESAPYQKALHGSIITKVVGPHGPTWMAVSQFSRLSDLEMVLAQKREEFEEKRIRNPKITTDGRVLNVGFGDMIRDPEFGPDASKLYVWISNKQNELFGFSKKEKDAWQKQQESLLDRSKIRQKVVIERMLREEQQGKRINVHKDNRFVTSLTKDSTYLEMQTVALFFSDTLSPEQARKIAGWMSKAKNKAGDVKKEPIHLPRLDGPGFHVLEKDTHPDFLLAAIRDRSPELGVQKKEIIEAWINDGHIREHDHSNRIRIFHSGLDHTDKTTELDLSKYDIDFVESLLHLLSGSDAALLPSHKSRLDRKYDDLLEKRLTPEWSNPEQNQVRALKGLADSIVESIAAPTASDGAKELLARIHRSEKRDKQSPALEKTTERQSDEKGMKDRIKALLDRLSGISKGATRERTKDKDEPLPSL